MLTTVTEGSLATLGTPLRTFQGTEVHHVTGWNAAPLDNDLVKFEGKINQVNQVNRIFRLPICRVGPLETATAESCGDTTWTHKLIRLDHQARYIR